MACGCPSRIHRAPSPAPPFRLLDLPGEIQNQIVNYFILSEDPITIHEPRFNRHPSPPPRPRSRPRYDRPVPPTPPLSRSPSQEGKDGLGHTRLAIMIACRKLYREHWRTYYGDNMFEFTFDVLKRFAKEMPARCLSRVRRLRLRVPHRQYHQQLWRFLSRLRSLEELDLWLTKPVVVDETVEECCINGVKVCKRLKVVRFKREDDCEEGADQELVARDKELEGKANSLLTSRIGRKMMDTKEVKDSAGNSSDALATETPNSIDELST